MSDSNPNPIDVLNQLLADPSKLKQAQDAISKGTKNPFPFLESDEERDLKRRIEKRSNQPYYRENYARDLIPWIEKMMKDNLTKVIYVRDVPGRSEATLHAHISQAINYMEDCLDPTGKYKQFFKGVEITRSNARNIQEQWVKIVILSNNSVKLLFKDDLDYSTKDDILFALQCIIENANRPNASVVMPGGEIKPFTFSDSELLEIKAFFDKFTDELKLYSLSSTQIKFISIAS